MDVAKLSRRMRVSVVGSSAATSAAGVRWHSSSPYARHVGRIGALAVALGVGGLFGSGIAWADDTGTSQSASDSSPTAVYSVTAVMEYTFAGAGVWA